MILGLCNAESKTTLTGVERTFSPEDIIVSKTDTRGIITYGNDVFLELAGYKESEIIGKPHNIIRHPAMPHCAFKLVWDRVKSGEEIFAYVVNRSRNGDHYWVLAHVTPSFDTKGAIIGYHSNRRVPSRAAIAKIEPIYKHLSQIEASLPLLRDGMAAATAELVRTLENAKVSYDEFVLSL
jgi:PAS domain S-box-containing protein